MLITAPLSVLAAAGLAPNKLSRPKNDIQVTEIGNSLQLREVFGLELTLAKLNYLTRNRRFISEPQCPRPKFSRLSNSASLGLLPPR